MLAAALTAPPRAAPAWHPAHADLIERYAQLLAANGRLRIALEYLQMIPGGFFGCLF